jgi:hypothetical protein
MDVKSNNVDLTALTAIVSDPDLDGKVAEMRAAFDRVTQLHAQLHDAEVEADRLKAATLSEAYDVLKSDAGIAHAYAIEAW